MIFVVSAGHPPGRLFCAGLRPGSSIMRLLSVVPVSALTSVDTRRMLLMLRPLLSVCIVLLLLLMSRECGYSFIDRSSVSWLLVDDYCCSRCCRRRAILCSKCAAGWCCAACSGDGNIGKSAAAAASAAAVDAVGIVFVVIDSRTAAAAAGGKYTLAQWLCRWRGAALRCMVVVIVMMTTTTGTVDGVGIANSGALRWLFVY